jgi:flavodoxin I
MQTMKMLIIYDSTFGNTERIARIIAHTLRVHDSVQVFSVEETNSIALKDATMLIIGCPTQRHGLTPAVRALLEGMPRGSLRGVSAAAFDTRYHMSAWKSGSAAQRIANRLKRAGATLLMPPESIFVAEWEGPLEQGELERAVQWVKQVYAAFEASSRAEQGQVKAF